MKALDYFPEIKKFDDNIQPILEAVFLMTYKRRKKKTTKKKAITSAKAVALSEAVSLVSQDNLKRIKDKFGEVL